MQRQAMNLLNKIVLIRFLGRVGEYEVFESCEKIFFDKKNLLKGYESWWLSKNSFIQKPCLQPYVSFRFCFSFSFYALMPFYINFTISFFTISIYFKKKVEKGEKN